MQIKLLLAFRDMRLSSDLCADVVLAAGGRIAGEPTDMAGVMRAAAVARPDVLLLEHSAGEEEISWSVLSGLRHASARTRVLLLCDTYTHLTLIGFIRHGASGCLLKSSGPWLYAKAVSTVFRGETWFGRSELLQALRSQIDTHPVVARELFGDQKLLTTRECEILELIGHALSNKEIARELKISDKTVKTHLQHIYTKLQKSGRYKAFLSKSLDSPGYP